MNYVTSKLPAYINYIILLLLVVVTYKSNYQYIVLVFPLFLLPFIDRGWSPGKSVFQLQRNNIVFITVIAILVALPVIIGKITLGAVFAILLFSALPEEWFFRAYLLKRLGNDIPANIISSLLFCSLHAIGGNYIHAVLVFIPSFFMGYVFEKTASYGLVASLHLIFNVVYVIFVN